MATSTYSYLIGLLEQDPANLSLLADAAEAAFAEAQFDAAQALLDRQARVQPLSPQSQHLAGLIAMLQLDWDRAAALYRELFDGGHDAPPIRYNLAWSLAMGKHFEIALGALDEVTSAALPQAAELEVQLRHQLGDLEQALERAEVLLKLHPEHPGLNAAISTLAIDVEDVELARRTAEMGAQHPDALTTRGTLALQADDPMGAAELFDAALVLTPSAPRALIGRGLTRLLGDDKSAAAADIDRGAELFGTHLGSWVSAGWAHLLAGDRTAARARFEKAAALDDRFGDAQGSLAVLDLLEGKTDAARRRADIARRLDPGSFSAAFAAMLFAIGDGKPDVATRIFETALSTPVDENGKTLAQTLVRLGVR